MEELLEGAQQELEWLEELQNDEEALKESGIKPEKLPSMIENMKKAVKKYEEKVMEYSK